MSQSAQIILIDHNGNKTPKDELVEQIKRIREWDNGHNYPIEVFVRDKCIMDYIARVDMAIQMNLGEYIGEKFSDNSGLWVKYTAQPEYADAHIIKPHTHKEHGVQKKVRKGHSNYTAPKKRKK
jgi:hypothetical protein